MPIYVKLGFLGPDGTFGYDACIEYERLIREKYGDLVEVERIPFKKHKELLDAVCKGEIDEGVVPFYNSENSQVRDVNQIFESSSCLACDLSVCDRIDLLIEQNILTSNDTVGLRGLQYLLSHIQPFGQCDRFIEGFLNEGITKIATVKSTARAAQIMQLIARQDLTEEEKVQIAEELRAVKEGAMEDAPIGEKLDWIDGLKERGACICNISCAGLYDLRVLAERVQNTDHNTTVFQAVYDASSMDTLAERIGQPELE